MTTYQRVALGLGLACSIAGIFILCCGAVARASTAIVPRSVWIVAAVLLALGSLWLADLR